MAEDEDALDGKGEPDPGWRRFLDARNQELELENEELRRQVKALVVGEDGDAALRVRPALVRSYDDSPLSQHYDTDGLEDEERLLQLQLQVGELQERCAEMEGDLCELHQQLWQARTELERSEALRGDAQRLIERERRETASLRNRAVQLREELEGEQVERGSQGQPSTSSCRSITLAADLQAAVTEICNRLAAEPTQQEYNRCARHASTTASSTAECVDDRLVEEFDLLCEQSASAIEAVREARTSVEGGKQFNLQLAHECDQLRDQVACLAEAERMALTSADDEMRQRALLQERYDQLQRQGAAECEQLYERVVGLVESERRAIGCIEEERYRNQALQRELEEMREASVAERDASNRHQSLCNERERLQERVADIVEAERRASSWEGEVRHQQEELQEQCEQFRNQVTSALVAESVAHGSVGEERHKNQTLQVECEDMCAPITGRLDMDYLLRRPSHKRLQNIKSSEDVSREARILEELSDNGKEGEDDMLLKHKPRQSARKRLRGQVPRAMKAGQEVSVGSLVYSMNDISALPQLAVSGETARQAFKAVHDFTKLANLEPRLGSDVMTGQTELMRECELLQQSVAHVTALEHRLEELRRQARNGTLTSQVQHMSTPAVSAVVPECCSPNPVVQCGDSSQGRVHEGQQALASLDPAGEHRDQYPIGTRVPAAEALPDANTSALVGEDTAGGQRKSRNQGSAYTTSASQQLNSRYQTRHPRLPDPTTPSSILL